MGKHIVPTTDNEAIELIRKRIPGNLEHLVTEAIMDYKSFRKDESVINSYIMVLEDVIDQVAYDLEYGDDD